MILGSPLISFMVSFNANIKFLSQQNVQKEYKNQCVFAGGGSKLENILLLYNSVKLQLKFLYLHFAKSAIKHILCSFFTPQGKAFLCREKLKMSHSVNPLIYKKWASHIFFLLPWQLEKEESVLYVTNFFAPCKIQVYLDLVFWGCAGLWKTGSHLKCSSLCACILIT
jgi:hypothetical protein